MWIFFRGYAFMKIKIFNSVISWRCPVRLRTAPTGHGENIALPNYVLKLHPSIPVDGISAIMTLSYLAMVSLYSEKKISNVVRKPVRDRRFDNAQVPLTLRVLPKDAP